MADSSSRGESTSLCLKQEGVGKWLFGVCSSASDDDVDYDSRRHIVALVAEARLPMSCTSWLGAGALLLGGCATVPLAQPDALLSEGQTIDLMQHPNRWIGRTITLKIYPYDNGYRESYVACLEPCDAAGADQSIFLVYTREGRFEGYRGNRAETVQAVFARICPESMPLCLDAPIRIFALNEVN